jgi:hypothetical protein
MAVTYYVALPFVRTEEGVAPGQAQEMPNEPAAIRRPEPRLPDLPQRHARLKHRHRHERSSHRHNRLRRCGQ